jgi:hypothetical protein
MLRTMRRPTQAGPPIAALLTAGLLATGCGGGGGGDKTTSQTTTAKPPPPPAQTTTAKPPPPPPPAKPKRTARENAWFPLTPGFQTVQLGKVNRGHRRLSHRRVVTVTDVHKRIDGTSAIGVLDQDFDGGGGVSEQSLDYFAVGKGGTVYYLGSYTEGYEGGQFISANDGWLAGVDGATKGLYMLGRPRLGTGSYTQENRPGTNPTIAQIARREKRTCVPYKCFKNTLVIVEDGVENKYFARGVGGIKTEPVSGSEQETEALINVRQLSRRGLGEISRQLIALDKHARSVLPGVFGQSSPARRKR